MSSENPQEHDDAKERREESLRVIQEQMSEMQSALEKVSNTGAVDKDTAVSLEHLCPGVISNVCHLASFTAAPSRTNADTFVRVVSEKLTALKASVETTREVPL